MQEIDIMREEIERARRRLDAALENGTDVDEYYRISVELDKKIEAYIDFCEKEQVNV